MTSPTDAGNVEWTEEQISLDFGDEYDQLKDNDEIVWRFLKNWYLTRDDSKIPDQRLPLPPNQAMKNHSYVIHGILQPEDPSQRAAIPIRIKGFDMWSIDRSSTLRGIWIATQQAWYWLKQPSEHNVEIKVNLGGSIGDKTSDNLVASFPSQEKQHLEMRAKFGLISNLCDIFIFNDEEPESWEYTKRHMKKKAEVLHEELIPTAEMQSKYPDRPTEPFDLNLLKRFPTFVKNQMLNLTEDFSSHVGFMKSLKNPTKHVYENDDLEQSALAAEARSSRLPWGELCPSANRLNPNWVFAESLEAARTKVATRKRGTRRNRAANGAEEQPETPAADNDTRVGEKRSSARIKSDTVESNDEIVHTEEWKDETGTGTEQAEAATEYAPPRDKPAETLEYAVERKEKERALPPECIYSEQRMQEAMTGMMDVLEPTFSGPYDLDAVRSESISLACSKGAEKMISGMREGSISSWEHRIMVALAFTNACKSGKSNVFKTFFMRKTADAGKLASGATMLFEQWRRSAIDEIKSHGEVPELVQFEFLVEMCRSIESCKLIDTATKLHKMEERGVHWSRGLMEVRDEIVDAKLADKHLKLHDVFKSAQLRLDTMKTRVTEERKKRVVAHTAPQVKIHLKEKAAKKKVPSSSSNFRCLLSKASQGAISIPRKSAEPTKQNNGATTVPGETRTDQIETGANARADPRMNRKQMPTHRAAGDVSTTAKYLSGMDGSNSDISFAQTYSNTRIDPRLRTKKGGLSDGVPNTDMPAKKIAFEKAGNRTQPTWMEPPKQRIDHHELHGKTISNSGLSADHQPRSAGGPGWARVGHEPVGNSRETGLGRGRDRNKPVWMARDPGVPLESAQRVNPQDDLVHRKTITRSEIGPPLGHSHVPRTIRPYQSQVQKQQAGTFPKTGRSVTSSMSGAGLGRGGGRNLPAWMTTAQTVTGGTNALSDQHPSTSVVTGGNPLYAPARAITHGAAALGRGRGKERNLPAWMTSKQRNETKRNETKLN